MSKFFEALEQAEQERLQRENSQPEKNREARPVTDAPKRVSEPAQPQRAAAKVTSTTAAPPRPWSYDDIAGEEALEDHLVSLLTPTSAEAEQYRTLCCAIEQAHHDSNLRIVAVTSPGAGEGKTLTAINMAATLAQTPKTGVLLIDADLRQPSIADRLGIDDFEAPGFIEAIQDPSLTLKSVARRLPAFNISVVTAGQSLDSPYEALKSPRLESLIDEARATYDYIVVDTPPVIPVPDCRVIARWVEGFIIIVAAHQTPRKLLEETLNVFEPNKVLGLVFNRDDLPLADYYGYAYAYGYGRNQRNGGNDRRSRKPAFARSPFAADVRR
jgi:capsular exopolysaccharide synthesis family protein